MSQKRVVVSGIRPTAEDQHLGNLLGAILFFVELARNAANDCFFFIADQHALTTSGVTFDAEGIRKGRRAIVLNLLAAGVDPEATIYAQSAIPETSELSWILGCFARVHDLEGMHHWVDKKERLVALGAEANAGLLTYPVLMTADIVGPGADLVPVGRDQYQHVEFARDLATTFNRLTNSSLLRVPALYDHNAVAIRSLSDPRIKMGKSDPGGCVFVNDPPEVVRQKLRRAVSDPARERRTDVGNPENCNVFTLHQLLSQPDRIAWAQKGCQTASIGCVECKLDMAGTINSLLAPIQERRRGIEAKGSGYVDEVLDAGNRRARARIQETVVAVKDLMGLSAAVKER